MHTTLIVTHFVPGSEEKIAQLFAESDGTELPELIGVQRRRLYTTHDVYIHLVEADRPIAEGLAQHRGNPLFQQLSKDLDEFIVPFEGKWGSVHQASARKFYHWERGLGVIEQ
jgi:hypothetical protein